MRSRILALIILILVIGIPAGLYYYFTSKKVASVRMNVSPDIMVRVDLVGTFGLDGLPMADTVLKYGIDCQSKCTLSPVLPARYQVTITSTGYVTQTREIIVPTGQTVETSFALEKDIDLIATGSILRDIPAAEEKLRALSGSGGEPLSLIGVDSLGRPWAHQVLEDVTRIGVVVGDRYVPYQAISGGISGVSLDQIGHTLVIHTPSGKTYLYSTDLLHTIEIDTPPNEILDVTFSDPVRIRTKDGVYDIVDGTLMSNIRFTDYIDTPGGIRYGYVSGSDTKRLELSNYPLDQSILIRLDRNTGETTVLRRGVDISFFYLLDGQAYSVDTNNTSYLLR